MHVFEIAAQEQRVGRRNCSRDQTSGLSLYKKRRHRRHSRPRRPPASSDLGQRPVLERLRRQAPRSCRKTCSLVSSNLRIARQNSVGDLGYSLFRVPNRSACLLHFPQRKSRRCRSSKPGVVDLIGLRQSAPQRAFLQAQSYQAGPGGIERGGISAGAAANDDHIVNMRFVHGIILLIFPGPL